MSYCPNCGQELPDGALFCSSCGSKVVGVGPPAEEPGPEPAPDAATTGGFAAPPIPQHEAKRSFTSRRGFVLALIAILVVLLLGTTFETGMIGSYTGAPAMNSPRSPLTGQQLYAAYTSNASQATTSYTNKTVYIQDTLDTGVSIDLRTGAFYSTVDSGSVVLIWNSPYSQVERLTGGETVLAKCSVLGPVTFRGGFALYVYLQNCDLISARSQSSSTTTQVSIPASSA